MNQQMQLNQPLPSNYHGAESGAPARACPFARTIKPSGASLAEALKVHTSDAHTRAERHPMQARLVKGLVTRAQYAAYLGQLLHVWRALDAGLKALARRDARIAAIVKPYHAHADRIVADLDFLDQCAGDHSPLPATIRFVETVTNTATAASPNLVGVWYVLEGSANGGQFIAKALSRGLGITGPEGLTSLDPHGQAQRERWSAWRASFDAHEFSEAERVGIINAAIVTFDAVYDLMDGLDDKEAPPILVHTKPSRVRIDSHQLLHAQDLAATNQAAH